MNSHQTVDFMEDARDWIGFDAAVDQVITEVRRENMKNAQAFSLLSSKHFMDQLKKDYKNNEQVTIAFNEAGKSRMKGPDALKAGMWGRFPSKVAHQAAKDVIMAQVARQSKYQMLKKAIIDVQSKSQEMDKVQNKLKQENTRLRKALDDLKLQDEYRGAVEHENKELKDKVHTLQDENRQLTHEVVKLRAQVEELQACKGSVQNYQAVKQSPV